MHSLYYTNTLSVCSCILNYNNRKTWRKSSTTKTKKTSITRTSSALAGQPIRVNNPNNGPSSQPSSTIVSIQSGLQDLIVEIATAKAIQEADPRQQAHSRLAAGPKESNEHAEPGPIWQVHPRGICGAALNQTRSALPKERSLGGAWEVPLRAVIFTVIAESIRIKEPLITIHHLTFLHSHLKKQVIGL